MYHLVTFSPKARMIAYDGRNKDDITRAVSEMFNGTVNDSMGGMDGSLLVVLPGGATHVLLPGYSIVEFLGELRVVHSTKLQVV